MKTNGSNGSTRPMDAGTFVDLDQAYLAELVDGWARRAFAAGRYDTRTHAKVVAAVIEAESWNSTIQTAQALRTNPAELNMMRLERAGVVAEALALMIDPVAGHGIAA